MSVRCRQMGNSAMIQKMPLRSAQHRVSIMHRMSKGEQQ